MTISIPMPKFSGFPFSYRVAHWLYVTILNPLGLTFQGTINR